MNNFDPKLKVVALGHNFDNTWVIDDYVVNAMFKLPRNTWTIAGLLLTISRVATTLPSYVADALTRLSGEGVVKDIPSHSDSTPGFKLTDEFLDFIDRSRGGVTTTPLLEARITVKGNPISPQHLLQFHQHIPWVLEKFKDLNEFYIGNVALTRTEAMELLKLLEDKNL